MSLKSNMIIKELGAKKALVAFIETLDENEAKKIAEEVFHVKNDYKLDKIIENKNLKNLLWLLDGQD